MRKYDFITSIIWMGLGIIVVISSYRLKLGSLGNPGAGLMPFVLGISLSLCSIPILIGSLTTKERERHEGIWSGIEFKKLILVPVSLIGYAMILEKVGFLVATFLLLFTLFKIIGSRRWSFALAVSILVVLLSYLLFVTLLKVEMPSGIWGIG
jgi:putative tricarboxylic transport membrane protein